LGPCVVPFTSIRTPARRDRKRNRRVRDREQVAVIRALLAARLHLGLPIPRQTLAEAVKKTGSSLGYVPAAVTILKAEDERLVDHLSRGRIPLVPTAAQIKRRAELIAALRQASPEDRVAALKHVAGARGNPGHRCGRRGRGVTRHNCCQSAVARMRRRSFLGEGDDRHPHLPALPCSPPPIGASVPIAAAGTCTGRRAMTLGSHQACVGKSQNWITPAWIITAIGPFDLDPYAADPRPWDCAHINWSTHGLEREWFGTVFLNPPYNRYVVSAWISKLARHGKGIALLHARTEVEWFERSCNMPPWSCSWPTGFISTGQTEQEKQQTAAPPVLAAFGDEAAQRLYRCGIGGALVTRWHNQRSTV
jgi:DNA N-6-adenine-methyltransferase (Dam)